MLDFNLKRFHQIECIFQSFLVFFPVSLTLILSVGDRERYFVPMRVEFRFVIKSIGLNGRLDMSQRRQAQTRNAHKTERNPSLLGSQIF